MEKHPKIFSTLARQSVKVGEQSGDIETILRQIADYTQKEQAAAKGVKGALTYPLIASIATIIVVIILVGFVLPAFAKLYDQMEQNYPPHTDAPQSLRFNSSWRTPDIRVLRLLPLGCAYLRTAKGKYQMDKFVLKIPLIGRVVHLKELGRCCRSISCYSAPVYRSPR